MLRGDWGVWGWVGQGLRVPASEGYWQELGEREKNEAGYRFFHLPLGESPLFPSPLPCYEVKGWAIPPPLPLLLDLQWQVKGHS